MKDIINLGIGNVTLLFNIWWAFGLNSDELKCRTILIHKKGDKSNVDNWRPITIGNILLRLYAKCWDSRLRENITLNARQKAFTPVDGCFENVKILQKVMKKSKKKKSELNIVSLDLAKAFDTVQHDSIRNALFSHGIPENVQQVIYSMYKDATTVVTVPEGTTRGIHLKNGVKQGCPISPLIFNLILDDLIKKLDSSGMGIRIEDAIISCMCFADDLILMSDNNEDMNLLLKITEAFFDEKHLKVNALKCQSLRR